MNKTMNTFNNETSAGPNSSNVKEVNEDMGNCRKETITALLIFNQVNKCVTDPFSSPESNDDFLDQSSSIKLNTMNSAGDNEFFNSDESTDSSPDLTHSETEYYLSDDDMGRTNFDNVVREEENVESEEKNIVSDQKNQRTNILINKLRDWALLYRIAHLAPTALLLILRNFTEHTDLPIDARTILKTPTYREITQIDGGEYLHFRFERAIRSIIQGNKKKE